MHGRGLSLPHKLPRLVQPKCHHGFGRHADGVAARQDLGGRASGGADGGADSGA
jgi:hypothetical protein